MRLLRRKRPDAAAWDAAAADDFWAWWRTASDDVAASIQEEAAAGFVPDIASGIEAIHPGLEWELGDGSASKHVLVISAGGVADMRAVAERVVRKAPPPDATWEYASARQPSPAIEEMTLQIDGSNVELAATRFVTAYDGDRAELDVRAYNPAFADIGRDAATRALYLIVDWVLGEDAVEQWIGEIGVQLGPPDESASVSIAGLREAVETLAATEPFWVVLGVEGEEIVVVARRPLKRPEFPLFDLRLDVSVALRSSDLGPAQAIDDEVLRMLGTDGMHAASVTRGGRRTSMFYCDAEKVPVPDVVAAVQAFAQEERVQVEGSLDPGWEAVRDFR